MLILISILSGQKPVDFVMVSASFVQTVQKAAFIVVAAVAVLAIDATTMRRVTIL
jgi:hypothetical protein